MWGGSAGPNRTQKANTESDLTISWSGQSLWAGFPQGEAWYALQLSAQGKPSAQDKGSGNQRGQQPRSHPLAQQFDADGTRLLRQDLEKGGARQLQPTSPSPAPQESRTAGGACATCTTEGTGRGSGGGRSGLSNAAGRRSRAAGRGALPATGPPSGSPGGRGRGHSGSGCPGPSAHWDCRS